MFVFLQTTLLKILRKKVKQRWLALSQTKTMRTTPLVHRNLAVKKIFRID
jgi:hypothetical protein